MRRVPVSLPMSAASVWRYAGASTYSGNPIYWKPRVSVRGLVYCEVQTFGSFDTVKPEPTVTQDNEQLLWAYHPSLSCSMTVGLLREASGRVLVRRVFPVRANEHPRRQPAKTRRLNSASTSRPGPCSGSFIQQLRRRLPGLPGIRTTGTAPWPTS